MKDRSGKLTAMLRDIAGDSANFSEHCSEFIKEKKELSDEEIRREVAHLLNEAEWTYLKAKYLVYFAAVKSETEGTIPAIEMPTSLTVYSDRYLVYELFPMANLRKKDERTGLGRVTYHEVLSLSVSYRKEFGFPSYEHPVVKFIHYVKEEDYYNGWIPDSDNLDCSKAIDGLVAGYIIPDDSCLAIDLIHEGRLSDRTYTEIHVYEKGRKQPKKAIKTITKYMPNGTQVNSYSFTPV